MIPVIIIEGPTASGKTDLALKLAEAYHTEIISADSRQVYKHLNIGTAKPDVNELGRVKHHLIDVITPDQSFNAGEFRKHALHIIRELHAKGQIPIVCGGTGLYIKALLEGLFIADIDTAIIRQQLEAELLCNGLGSLYSELREIDGAAAERISENDKQRILRALEVYRATGLTISEHWKKQERQQELHPFRILLQDDRKLLYNRIDKRILTMIEAGLINEINEIIALGYDWTDPGFNSVGYKEFRDYFAGEAELEDCIEAAQQHTRNYAKRQITWYRKCSFHLAETHSSIIIDNVREKIDTQFK